MTHQRIYGGRTILATLAIVLAAAGMLRSEEKLTFPAGRKAGELTRVTAKLEVRGELKMMAKGKPSNAPLAVVGEMKYDERIVVWGAKLGDVSRAARHYEQAEAHLTINDKGLPVRSLDDAKRLIAVKTSGGESTIFAPDDLLTRDELDLVTLPGDSLAIDRLLPDDAVAVGGSWKQPAKAIVLLCNLDDAESVDVESTLKEANDQEARFEMTGKVQGAIDGLSTELDLAAKYTYDRRLQRITWIALSVKENRAIGHVGPGVEATSRLQLLVEPLDHSAHLAADRVAGMKLEGGVEQTALLYKSPSGQFTLAHDRQWHVIADDPKITVMRRLDRGDLVAQVNITPLPPYQAGKAPTVQAFQADVEKVLGKQLGGIVKAGERKNDRDYRICRVEAVGKVSDVDIQWIYFHMVDRDGRAVAVAFTLESKLAEAFGGADETLLAGLHFVTDAAAEPTAEAADRSVLSGAKK